jgi:hypothetical protein
MNNVPITDPLSTCIQLALRSATPFLRPAEVRTVANALSSARQAGPDRYPDLIAPALTILLRQPEARTRLLLYLRTMQVDLEEKFPGMIRDLAESSSGTAPPEAVLACPVDPTHYQKPNRESSPHPKCPLHGVDLVALEGP